MQRQKMILWKVHKIYTNCYIAQIKREMVRVINVKWHIFIFWALEEFKVSKLKYLDEIYALPQTCLSLAS